MEQFELYSFNINDKLLSRYYHYIMPNLNYDLLILDSDLECSKKLLK